MTIVCHRSHNLSQQLQPDIIVYLSLQWCWFIYLSSRAPNEPEL